MLPDGPLRTVLTCSVAVAAAAALTGCGGSSKATGPSAGSGAANTITIADFTYRPNPLRAVHGQAITVVNNDSATHTLTALDGSFDSKDLHKGQRYTFTPGKAGSYRYLCSIHNYMTGTLTVS